jgi:hypothetical protein
MKESNKLNNKILYCLRKQYNFKNSIIKVDSHGFYLKYHKYPLNFRYNFSYRKFSKEELLNLLNEELLFYKKELV